LELRGYQRRARTLARKAYAGGARAILYVAPTGAGKTVILGDTIASHVRRQAGARVNIYAHRRELLTQAARTFRAFGLEVGVFGEGKHHPVQVCSVQATLARGEVDACTLACFDEAHHFAADEWSTIFDAHKQHGAIIVGATATPERGDGRGLDRFDHLVIVAQPRELVESGALVPCEVIKPARAVPKGKVATTPMRAYAKYAHGRRAVVFAPNVASAEAFALEFGNGMATVVHGKLKADERDSRFAAFADGRVRVLVNVMVATEGWDCPACDVAILARDCGSTGLYLQMAGRIMRPAPGKKDCLLIDLRGAALTHGHPQDDREYSLEGLGISAGTGTGLTQAERLCKLCKHPLDDAMVCTNCGRDHALAPPTSAEIELERWGWARKEDEAQRVERLARWFKKWGGIREHGGAGRKSWFYMMRFKTMYGRTPLSSEWRRAREMANV
jgi:superfamily II DNA or RNA helicase